jgi:hypothetical protein
MAGSKSPVQATIAPGANSLEAEGLGAAGQRGAARSRAVRDVVGEAAGQVGVAIAVEVAIGHRRGLGHRLLVAEVAIAVEVDVDRVVDAGDIRVGHRKAGRSP